MKTRLDKSLANWCTLPWKFTVCDEAKSRTKTTEDYEDFKRLSCTVVQNYQMQVADNGSP